MMSDLFNPITSTRTKLVEVMPNGVRIYSHTARNVAGRFIAASGPHDWSAAESLEDAREKGTRV